MSNGLRKNHIVGISLGVALLATASFLSLGSVPTEAQVSCTPPSAGIVSWWPADGRANDAQDGNNGSLQNGATFAAGKVGQAFNLDGVNGYVRLTNNANLQPTTGYTIEAWVNPTALSTQENTIMAKNLEGTYDVPYYLVYTGRQVFGDGRNGFGIGLFSGGWRGVSSGEIPQLNTWYHVAGTYDGTTFKIYVNGVLKQSRTYATTIPVNTATAAIGRHSNTFPMSWSGRIDEATIYDRALSGDDIAAIYNAGSSGKCNAAIVCGNAFVEAGEQCDDGNTVSGDGCNSACQLEGACVPPPAQLVSWWPAELAANDIQDGNNGSLGGGTIFVSGKVGQAFSFDGVDDHVRVPPSANLNDLQQFTLDFWMNNRDTRNDKVVVRREDKFFIQTKTGSGGQDLALGIFRSTGSLGGILYTSGANLLNGMHHIALTYDGSALKVYVDGALNTQASIASALGNDPTQTLWFGRYLGGNGWNGVLDEVEIFNRALSDVEIRSMYNAGSFGKCRQSADTTPPETTISTGPSAVSANNIAVFEFSSNESGSAFECSLDSAAFTACASPTTYNGVSDGPHIFEVRARDTAGNIDLTPAVYSWTVDTVAPISTAVFLPQVPDGQNGWYMQTVLVNVNANDSGSGVKEIRICADMANTCTPAVGASAAISGEGDNYVRYFAIDNAGNQESLRVDLVKVDLTSPFASLNSLLVFDGDGMVDLVWSASDAVSGVSSVEVYRNGQLIHTSSNPSGNFIDNRSAVGDDGQTFSYVVRAKDNVGRTGDSSAQSTTIDLSPPTVPGMAPLSAYTNSLLVLAQWDRAVDATAGVDFYGVYRNTLNVGNVDEPDPNGTDATVRRSYTDTGVTNGNTFTYRVSATDLAVPSHESAQSDPAVTTIDVTAPVTTKTFNPATPNGQNGWFVTPFGVTLSCGDAVSGCNDTKYSVNNGAFVTYSGTFLVETDGSYLIEYFSTDNAGNSEAEKSQTEKLDQTKPAIVNNPVPSATNNSSLTLSGTVTDTTSGVTSFAINGIPVTLGAGVSYSHAVSLNEGQNSFTEVAKDAAGNTQLVVKQVTLDTAAPVATITSGPSSPTTETLATFTFTVNEAATFECQLDGGAFSVCVSPKTYAGLAEGAHTVLARARDAAGNLGAPASFSWTIVLSPDSDGDGIFNEIDTLPSTFSSDFDDRPLGGITFGTISSRGGLTLAIEKPVASNVVRVSASGVGTTAVVNACAENFRVLVTSGDVTDIVCGASITAEALVTPDDVVVRSTNKNGRFGRLHLRQGERGTMADPPLEVTMTAAGTNATRVEFDVADEATGNVLATGTLDSSESVKVDFSDSVAVSYVVIAGTVEMVADGTPLSLSAGLSFTDQCLGVSGNLANTGCPVGDKNIVTLHNVYLGGGTTSKAPLADARVRVFDRNNPNFQTVAGSKNPDGSLYGVIYEADAGRVGACTTGADGICFAGERAISDFLVIVKYADAATGKVVYIGRPKSPEDFTDTNGDGAGDLATKDFQIMKVFKKGVFQEYRGGSKLVVTGSMLEVIMPESAVWEGAQSIYPFVFSSDSDWTVDVCAEVPAAGYQLAGTYDEEGNLIATTQCVQTVVANQTKVIAFGVKEVSSPEPLFTAKLKLKNPKGKMTEVVVKVSDMRRATFEAHVKDAKANMEAKRTKGDKMVRLTKVGASLWSIIRDVFGLEGRDAEIVTTGKKVARLNAIRVPEWGITEGTYDATALPWGFVLELGGEEGLRLAR